MKKLPDNQKSRGLMIRNSTAEFFIFTADSSRDGLEVRFQYETVWLTQKLMAELFQCSTDNISLHLKNIFKDGELEKKSITEEFSVIACDGKQYRTKHNNLDAIIAQEDSVSSILEHTAEDEKNILPNLQSLRHYFCCLPYISKIDFNRLRARPGMKK